MAMDLEEKREQSEAKRVLSEHREGTRAFIERGRVKDFNHG